MDHIESKRGQRGVMLLEALIGILIFSIGILAMVAMQGLAIGYASDAKYRTDASFLANELIGQIWLDRPNLANYAYPGGSSPALTNWVAKVNNYLPGAGANAPTVAVNAATGEVDITIRWQPPSSTSGAHNYRTVARVSNP